MYLSEGEHQAVHKAGKGAVKGVKEADLKGWNQEWKDFKGDHPFASQQEIFEEGGRLMNNYKISTAESLPTARENRAARVLARWQAAFRARWFNPEMESRFVDISN